ncbi:MAG: hypothetical protein ACOVQU_06430 [Exiguobacterium acetylicum]
MTIYTDRITLVFPITAKNRQAAASLQTLEITESGNEFEKLVPLDPAKVADYASQFNLPLLAEIEELKTKHAEAITKLEQDHATVLATKATELAEVQADLLTKSSQLEATTQAKTALDLQVATLTTEKQSLADDVSVKTEELALADSEYKLLEAKVAELEAKVVELTPPPKPESVTPAQIRIWLLSNGIDLETVNGMIAAIADETIRQIAQVRWEYGLVVLRDDPLVQQMGAALGLTVDQMDAAFLAASQIV